MSVEAMSFVLNQCRAKGTEKLVMIGIANHADNRGRNAWPSISTLAAYANVSERSVQLAIVKLVAAGELLVQDQRGGDDETRGDRRPNRYVIVGMQPVDNGADGVKSASPRAGNGVKPVTPRGEAQRVHGVKPASPEPSLEPSMNRPSSRTSQHNPTPPPVDNPDDDDDLITGLVAAKLVHRESLTGKQPSRGYAIQCAANLQRGGPDHDQVLELRRLITDGMDRAAAAERIVTGGPIRPVSAGAAVISIEERQAVSHVAGLCLAGLFDDARVYVTEECPPGARGAAEAELARRLGRRTTA